MKCEFRVSPQKLIQAKIPGPETGIEVKKTICSVCGAQCGIDAYVRDGRLVKVEGTAENPTNRGRLCVKGAANRQYVYHPERLRTPMVRTGEKGSENSAPFPGIEALDTDRLQADGDQGGIGTGVGRFFYGLSQVAPPVSQEDGPLLRLPELLHRIEHVFPRDGPRELV